MKIIPLLIATASLCVACQKDAKPSEKISAEASDSVAAAVASQYENSLKNMNPQGQNPQMNPMANQANTASQVTPANQATAVQTNVPVTKPGMNPPHGQPGHRCDIAVGTPLNSKPAANSGTNAVRYTPPTPTGQAQTTTTANNIPAILQPTTGATPATPAKPQTTLAGMQGKPNPAHGQEGHRCDVKVGDPLP
ncbi:hypothetical protein [Flavobacterium pedocola]